MKKKIIGIFIVTLLIATAVLPLISSANENVRSQVLGKISTDDGCGCNKIYETEDKNEKISIFNYPVMTELPEPLEPKDASPKPTIIDAPDYFSWKNYNGKDWTTSAKDQGMCGSCWDFAAVGALESVVNIREGCADIDPDLSEQYVLSCLPDAGSCTGGLAHLAFKYIMSTTSEGNYYNGVIPESCMPYQADDTISCEDKCPDWDEFLLPILDYGYWTPDGSSEDIEAIKTQIMQTGPVATYMLVIDDFSTWGFTHHDPDDYYSYPGPVEDTNHVVIFVGWKDDPSIGNGGYWICKNSWTTVFGYDGFFNIEYGSLNIDSTLIDWVDYDPESFDWPPFKPSISGPGEGEIEEEYYYYTSAIDPNDRQVSYMWDWGDGTVSEWFGPYNSGETVNASHAWSDRGIYIVKVKAKNTDELESEWSDSIIVGIPIKNEGIDQIQDETEGWGYGGWGGTRFAQSFIPSKNTLTKVMLYMWRVGNPEKITISIRDDLNRMDLISVEKPAGSISEKRTWIEFDFSDIDVIPSQTYYIVWDPDGDFDKDNTFYWTFGKNDPYYSGCGWSNVGSGWKELYITGHPDPDFCFKTYYANTKLRNREINTPFQNIFEQFTNLFPLLQKILLL